MIFYYATLLGLVAAALRALWPWPRGGARRAEGGVGLRWWPLALAAIAVQLYLVKGWAVMLPDAARVPALWATHAALTAVVIANLPRPGMRWMLAGMLLNYLVMAANGGLMPVSPETLIRGRHSDILERTAVGEPIRRAKDVILREEDTRFALLSDRIVVPFWRGSSSAGDVLIAIGIVTALYGAAGRVGDGTRRAPRDAPWATRATPAVT